ncbi:MAG: hypothetical protein HZB91_09695 [Elusimicrobia bacterium]|nr:hypothetical protein [Elusimicrobiota bacterium]
MIRIGLLSEGGVDEALLPSLLAQLAGEVPGIGKAEIDWRAFPFEPNGYGEIPKTLELLTKLYSIPSEWERLGCDLFVVVHDSRKTEEVQKDIKNILGAARDFPAVYGLAIQEVEAWVLGDIENVNKNVFKIYPLPKLPTAPERDKDPKKTLTDLFVKRSKEIEFDRWNAECARKVAEFVRASQVRRKCPRGFGAMVQSFRRARLGSRGGGASL